MTYTFKSSKFNELLKIDPRTKLLLFFSATLISFRGVDLPNELLLFGVITLLLLNAGQYTYALRMLLIYGLFINFELLFAPFIKGYFAVIVITLMRIMRIYFPMMMTFVLLIKSTTVSEFISAFGKMGISLKIIIPFSVMFRFFPTIKEEWQAIKDAMRFRGIGVSLGAFVLKPVLYFEYVLVPLLMSCMKISDELSAASLARGLDYQNPRTSLVQVNFGSMDLCLVFFCITMVWLSFK